MGGARFLLRVCFGVVCWGFAVLGVNSVGCFHSFCYFRYGVTAVDTCLLVDFCVLGFGIAADCCG